MPCQALEQQAAPAQTCTLRDKNTGLSADVQSWEVWMHLLCRACSRNNCDGKASKHPPHSPPHPIAARQARQSNTTSFEVSKTLRPAAPRSSGAQPHTHKMVPSTCHHKLRVALGPPPTLPAAAQAHCLSERQPHSCNLNMTPKGSRTMIGASTWLKCCIAFCLLLDKHAIGL